jgi:hypothetical protein
MKLNPPQTLTVRVHELARELGWTSGQLLDELRQRGEFVKSASSVLEAPVVRAIRVDFAAVEEAADPEAIVAPAMYGRSAELLVDAGATEFAEALATAESGSQPKVYDQAKSQQWRPPILQVLLEEVIVPERPDHLAAPEGSHFAWELKKAAKLNARWAEARLNGLGGDDAFVIRWIRLSDGQRPDVAADLASCGITPEEAGLRIGHGGRIDARLPIIYERFRNRRISRSETIALTRQ